MGWTHSWQRVPELPIAPFQAAVGDLQKLLKATDIPLAGKEGTGNPFISLDEITFNGTHGRHCEDFTVRRSDSPRHGRSYVFSFCKTGHMPYDLCVKCTLIILRHHFNDKISVYSDGTDEDWRDAVEHCQKILDYGNDFKLSKED